MRRAAAFGSRPIKLGALLATTLFLGSCSSTPGACWGLSVGNHLTLELLESYTPASSYTYKRLPENASSTHFLDESPSCGPGFDYATGDSLHITITALSEPNQMGLSCRGSEFGIDSPERLDPLPTNLPGAFLQGGDPVLYNGNTITVGGCSTLRSMTLVSTGSFPGVVSEPVPGQLPPLVLVRAAGVRARLADGSCDPGTDTSTRNHYCVDEFVVRIKNE